MGSIRPTRRLWAAAVALVLALPIAATTGAAAASQVTGTLTFSDQIVLSKNAVAVVVLLDQTADPTAGAILGEDRIDDPGAVPIAFSVPYTAAIDQTHSYALYASIVDGTNTWENDEPVPVITGGPTSGVEMLLSKAPTSFGGTISGTIVESAEPVPGPESVVVSALINQKTGTLVGHEFNVSPTEARAVPAQYAFSIGYDPTIIDPAVTYVVKAAILDGSTFYEGREGVTAISAGVPVENLTVPVAPQPGAASPSVEPSASVEPSPSEEASTEPSVEPSPSVTPKPTRSPRPTPTPTPSPTPTPTPTPTPEPHAHAQPEPDTHPEPDARARHPPRARARLRPRHPARLRRRRRRWRQAPRPRPRRARRYRRARQPTPSPTPGSGVLSGTLSYSEPHPLSAQAVAVVVLVDGSGTPDRAGRSSR